jgi:hypothetical protein
MVVEAAAYPALLFLDIYAAATILQIHGLS